MIDRDKAHALLNEILDADGRMREATKPEQWIKHARAGYDSFLKLAELSKAPAQATLISEWNAERVERLNKRKATEISGDDDRYADFITLARFVHDLGCLLPPDQGIAERAVSDLTVMLPAGDVRFFKPLVKGPGNKKAGLVTAARRRLVQAVYFDTGLNHYRKSPIQTALDHLHGGCPEKHFRAGAGRPTKEARAG